MKTLVYIEIAEALSVDYEKPLLTRLTAELEGVVLFDVDNRSDGETIRIAKTLIEKSEKAVLIIHYIDEAHPEDASGIIGKAINANANVLWLVLGKSHNFDKYRQLLDKSKVFDNQSFEHNKQKIRDFLSI